VPARTCLVSFTDEHGIRHIAEVSASSLFEAAALGLSLFRRSGLSPRPTIAITVTLEGPVGRHELMVEKLEGWLARNGRTPREQALKTRLRILTTRRS